MIPKVETCIYALEQGVEGVVILDGKVPHAVLLELFTELGSGTLGLELDVTDRESFSRFLDGVEEQLGPDARFPGRSVFRGA